jgi:hypothetical protein
MKSANGSRSFMLEVSVDSIKYGIISETEAVVQRCSRPVTALLPRNFLAFGGDRLRVAHLDTRAVSTSVNVVLIPYSLHTIFCGGYSHSTQSISLLFEIGSELLSIDPSAFRRFATSSIFIPQSIRFIGSHAFLGQESAACVHFDRDSSLFEFKSNTFSFLSCLSAITIPGSVRRIHQSAFKLCKCLRCVTFELPSQCWCISFDAFADCVLLDSVILPPSIEVIDQTVCEPSEYIPCYFAPDNLHCYVENNCLTNGRELFQYQGSSKTLCVSHNITALLAESFLGNSTLTTLTFEAESRVTRLPGQCFSHCIKLSSVCIPKSVRVIGEHCFDNCSGLTLVTFESPSTLHTIKSWAFTFCRLLANFRVPSSVLTLEGYVFWGCLKLSSVTFDAPSRITHIPRQVFYGCHTLKTLHLPDSVTTVDGSAFELSGVASVASANFLMCEFLFVHCETVVRCFGEPSSIVIPSTVREIAQSAFSSIESIQDLSFEEGVVRIGRSAFSDCGLLEWLAFPASLEVIEEQAFSSCLSLSCVTFAAGSQLRCIGEEAFADCPLDDIVLPGNVSEIDPSAFDPEIWRIVTWDGPPALLVSDDCLCSADSSILLRCFSENQAIVVLAGTEVIGRGAFHETDCDEIEFEPGTRLREIAEEAFSRCQELESFTVPSSVETIRDRCFQHCQRMATITFEEPSQLKRIGEGAFLNCRLSSIVIPASVEEIDGSAFLGCPLLVIEVAAGSRNFKIEGNLLTTADGTQIVRHFGREREVIIPKTVEILGRSCFELCNHFERVVFENGSRLRQIDRSAFSGCGFLTRMAIPASVESIRESAFKKCDGLEEFLMDEDGVLVKLGKEAFADCCSLRSFRFPKTVGEVGENCFVRCGPLHLLIFGSCESLKNIVGDVTLDERLEHIGFSAISSMFEIEVNEEGVDMDFPGWVSVGDGDSAVVLIQANK